MQRSRIGNVAIDTLNEGELGGTAKVISLPVTCTGRTLAPVFLHVVAVDHNLVCGALVETGEVTAKHAEVGAHGECQGDVVVVNDTAVGADRYVNAGLLKVLVTSLGDLNHGSSLSATDTLGLTGDTNRTATDTDLDEVSAGLSQEAEALAVNDVAGTNLNGIAIFFADEGNGALLPLGKALAGVDTQYVDTCLNQRGNALGVVTGIDTCTDYVALLRIQQLVGVALMLIVVLTEYERNQMTLSVHDGERVELVIPDDVVGVLQSRALGCGDQLVEGSHEGLDLLIHFHAADAVVAAGDDTQQLTGSGAVIGNGDGGMTVFLLERDNVCQGLIGTDIGVGYDKAGLVFFDTANHLSLLLDRLRAVNEGNTALLGKGNRHLVIGNGLHDCGNQRDIHRDRRLLALLEFDQRSLQGDVRGNVLSTGITGNQQILRKGMGGCVKIVSHVCSLLFLHDTKLLDWWKYNFYYYSIGRENSQ